MPKRRAVITGAGQGMGRAIALRLARAGVHTFLIGRTESKLRRVAEEIAALGGEASAHAMDVTDDTGAGQGTGRAIALRFARGSCRVWRDAGRKHS